MITKGLKLNTEYKFYLRKIVVEKDYNFINLYIIILKI